MQVFVTGTVALLLVASSIGMAQTRLLSSGHSVVVYSAAKVHRFKGVGLPIFQWGFADAGTRVAYGQTTVHFGCETHYERRDIESERLIDSVDVPEPCGQAPEPKPVKIPQWVADLISKISRNR